MSAVKPEDVQELERLVEHARAANALRKETVKRVDAAKLELKSAEAALSAMDKEESSGVIRFVFSVIDRSEP